MFEKRKEKPQRVKADITELETREHCRLCNSTPQILLSAFLSRKVLGHSLEIIIVIFMYQDFDIRPNPRITLALRGSIPTLR